MYLPVFETLISFQCMPHCSMPPQFYELFVYENEIWQLEIKWKMKIEMKNENKN